MDIKFSSLEEYDNTDIYSVKEVAQRLNKTEVTIYRWCRSGILKSFRVNSSWKIMSKDLLDFINDSYLEAEVV